MTDDLLAYYKKRKDYIEQTILEEAVQLVKSMKNAKCLNAHELEFVFTLDDVTELTNKI